MYYYTVFMQGMVAERWKNVVPHACPNPNRDSTRLTPNLAKNSSQKRPTQHYFIRILDMILIFKLEPYARTNNFFKKI